MKPEGFEFDFPEEEKFAADVGLSSGGREEEAWDPDRSLSANIGNFGGELLAPIIQEKETIGKDWEVDICCLFAVSFLSWHHVDLPYCMQYYCDEVDA